MPTSKIKQLIYKKNFTKLVLNEESEIFVLEIEALETLLLEITI